MSHYQSTVHSMIRLTFLFAGSIFLAYETLPFDFETRPTKKKNNKKVLLFLMDHHHFVRKQIIIKFAQANKSIMFSSCASGMMNIG